jgi:hypothetical protein
VGTFKPAAATGWSALDPREYHLQSCGVEVVESKRVTVLSTTMQNAQHRGSGGNGYLFEVSRSNEVLFADCQGANGRHSFIQNWDFGTTGCVWLRCSSAGGRSVTLVAGVPVETQAYSEYHHSLALGNLVDSCTLEDGWYSRNRGTESSGAGHTATQTVVWNARGSGRVFSANDAWGYVIGTSGGLSVDTSLLNPEAAGTAPEDFVEGVGAGATLWPSSLYEEQRARRLGD